VLVPSTGDSPYRGAPEALEEAPVVIECDDLVHSFGAKAVLSGVTFRVARGSIFGFIGPNGAGKTTTLRILATLLEPTSGTARIAGHDVVTHPDQARRVLGYMPDGAAVHDRVTVSEYLEFFASAHGIRGEERTHAVARAIELTEIGRLDATQVTTLSKGQKQRLLLARTLLHDPEVLLLDEPASDLDPRARIELRMLLTKLGRMGKTILLSSHILTELAELCDAIGVLEGGRIVASGSLADVQARVMKTSGARLRLTILSSADEAVGVLSGLEPALSVEVLESRAGATTLTVAYEGGPPAVAEILARLTRANVAVCAAEPQRADLEGVFMAVTEARDTTTRARRTR
jgi:ABC-2 type transport system ATP-binding protein